jgi:hypothetical protein
MAKIATIAIPTKDRPESLRRALDSYMANAKMHGHAVDFFVLDRSSTPRIQAENKKAIRKLYDQHRLRVFYAVDREVNAYIARLVQRGVPRGLAFFALHGVPGLKCPVGGTRNAALFHTIGDCFLGVDDDMVCEVAGSPGGKETVRFLRRSGCLPFLNDPTTVKFFPSKEEAFSGTQFAWGRDVLSLFEQPLGLRSEECTQLTREQIRGYPTDNGVVRAVQAGLVGDIGLPSPAYFQLRGERGVTRHVFRAAPEMVMTSTVFCAPQPVALDNRDGIPPFLPTSSNEHSLGGESLMGALLSLSEPGSMVAHLPWAMKHDPPQGREFEPDAEYVGLQGVHLSQLVEHVVAQMPPRSSVRDVGKVLFNEAESGLKQFTVFLKFIAERRRTQLEESIRLAQRRAGESDELRKVLHVTSEAGDRECYSIPVEMQLGEHYGLEAAADITRFAARQYGRLLMAWDDVLEAARQVRQSGYRLGTIP